MSHPRQPKSAAPAAPDLEGITMQTNKKIAVAGATGRVGGHVVEVLQGAGHDVVAISRSTGVDIVTGEGLADTLEGVEVIIDTATGSSPEQQAAVEFFTASARSLQQAGQRAGVQRIVVVSILGCDRFQGGYGASTLVHERALASAGEIPVSVLRATQFHEFVEALVQWGTRGDVTYVPEMRTQLIAARSVAERLVHMATDPAPRPDATTPILEIAGPRPESLVEMAKLLVAHTGNSLRMQAVEDPSDPDHDLNVSGGLLPGPDAEIAGPTFAQWLDTRGPRRSDRPPISTWNPFRAAPGRRARAPVGIARPRRSTMHGATSACYRDRGEAEVSRD